MAIKNTNPRMTVRYLPDRRYEAKAGGIVVRCVSRMEAERRLLALLEERERKTPTLPGVQTR